MSSWVSVAAGPTWLDQGYRNAGETSKFESLSSLTLQTGIGTPPSGFLAVGGLFHLQTHFGRGTDLGLLARFASRGYVLGDWGAALDLGGYQRFWGVDSQGGLGQLSLGAPWGLVLSAHGSYGTNHARHVGATIGVDFARLTIFRTTGTNWFPNPNPGYQDARR